MIHNTQNAQVSQRQDELNIYVIMKTMCPPGYRHNGFVATHALGHMIYSYTLLVPMNQRVLNKLSKEHNISAKCSSCFCEIWALCVSWITHGHLYYALCLTCWALFGSLVPAICNRISSAQVHELPQSHYGNNREDDLFSR